MAAQSHNSDYSYALLRSDHFRVIEITNLEPTIIVQLTDYPDETPPEYFALSYAWGLEQATETILCSGKPFKVTPHLKEGLRCVCTRSGSRRLWVDAICINQGDDGEKETQVAKMHHIYKKSKGVYVWLGKEENDSDAAISAINEAQDAARAEPDLVKGIAGIKSEAPRLFDISSLKPLANLSRRSWFRRLWIVQEYFHARSVLFFCGMSALDDANLTNVLNRLSIYSFGPQGAPRAREESEQFAGFYALLDLNNIKDSYLEGNKLSFFDFVMLGRERCAKEPVDRIYAAFGMAEGSDTIYRKEILIDYSGDARHNYQRLYSDFGKIALLHEPNLRLLSTVSSAERPKSLPSWCPNLNSTSVTGELDSAGVFAAGWPFKEHGKDHDISESNPSSRCLKHSNFKGKDENHVLASPLTNTVSIWGATLGRISALAPPCEWNPDVNIEDISAIKPFARDMLKWLVTNEKFCKERIEDLTSVEFIWEEILVSGKDKTRRDKPLDPDPDPDQDPEPEPKKEGDEIYLFTVRLLHHIANLNPDNDGADPNSELLRYFEMIYTWVILIHEVWHDRVLFVTDNGKFGKASTDVAEGDSVCMLYGGRSMYVLREQGTEPLEYQFIGDAYVFDCMDGQVFDLMDEGVIKEEVFAIS
jgi:hypothetical protein